MKFCQQHWDDLRSAIDNVGLTALIAESGAMAVVNVISEIEEGTRIDNFDPLMRAHFAIASNVIEMARANGADDLARMLVLEPICPLCLANQMLAGGGPYTTDRLRGLLAAGNVRGPVDEWVDRAAADQLTQWQEMRP